MKQVELFIGGACNGNPGAGGWGAILRLGPHEKLLSGAAPDTTANRMELTAAIRGLRALIEPCEIRLICSRFLVDGATTLPQGWTRNGWVSASLRPIRNAELWHELLAATHRHEIRWEMDTGEAGHAEIERAKTLAQAAISTLFSDDPE